MSDSDSDDYAYAYSDDDSSSDEHASSAPPPGSTGSFKTPSKANPNAAPTSGRSKGSPSPASSLLLYESPTEKNPHGLRLMDAGALVGEMEAAVGEIVEMLAVPETTAGHLMRLFKWNKERLIEAYMSDADGTLTKAGVIKRVQFCRPCDPPPEPGQAKTPTRSSRRLQTTTTTAAAAAPPAAAAAPEPTPAGECQICCDDGLPPAAMYSMPGCAHHFCLPCWGGYVANKIGDGPNSVYMTCPAQGCAQLVCGEDVAKVAPDQLDKYRTYNLRSFVDLNANVRWCPGAGCEKVAASSTGGGDMHCDCGTSFCVRCGLEPHAPIHCKALEQWVDKCENESETANWILANTKKCPRCFTRIEKNQGCNHMVCSSCKFEFCWICMGDWREHGASSGGYYKCNKFADGKEDDKTDQSDAAKAKRELDRYLHYYQRYHAHAQAQTFAKKQLEQTELRMVQLQDSDASASWIDVQFLKDAVLQLTECRRVLKYTYAFAYYLTDNTGGKRERFEHHQEMLEKFTERLSELSEMSIDKMDKTDIVNQTRVVSRFLTNIITYVDNGMEDD